MVAVAVDSEPVFSVASRPSAASRPDADGPSSNFNVALLPRRIVPNEIVPAVSLALICTPCVRTDENWAATVDALTGPAPKVDTGNVTVCCAPPLTDTSTVLPANEDKLNCGADAPAAVAVFAAACPSFITALDCTISASGPPTLAGRLP